MGHSSTTCAISQLPITGGTPIVVVLLSEYPYGLRERYYGDWEIRAVPFRAKYNDYCGIDGVDEDSLPVKLAMSQFARDMVEQPLGLNPYHDPPTRHGMSFMDLMEALSESRLRIRQERTSIGGRDRKVRVPKGLPTWRRVEKILQRAVKDGKIVPGGHPTRLAYGRVRLCHEGDYKLRDQWVQQVREVLGTRYRLTERYEHGPKYHQECVDAAIKRGESGCTFDIWFEVNPLEGPIPPLNPHQEARAQEFERAIENDKGNRRFKEKVLHVSWAFIRQDVWDALVPLGGAKYSWFDTKSVEAEYAKGETCFRETVGEVASSLAMAAERAERKRNGTEPPMDPELRKALADILDISRDRSPFSLTEHMLERKWWGLKSTSPFILGLAGAFTDMAARVHRGEAEEKEALEVIRTLAEFNVIRNLMSLGCIRWNPTYCGPQDGAWAVHRVLSRALGEVIEKVVQEDEDERRSWETEEETVEAETPMPEVPGSE